MNYSARLSALLGVSIALVQVQTAHALTKAEVSRVAQGITVLIQNAQNLQDAGSGVIIKREGKTYTVLTARHVVENASEYKVMTPNEKQYSVIRSSIQKFQGVDLALIQFTSSEAYNLAKIGDSAQSLSGTPSFVAGFPSTTAVRSIPSFYFTSGDIAANANQPLNDGYAIAYNNPTLPGMSGGPVLNEKGQLIGIHGRAESAVVPQNAQLRSDVYILKTEFNYAVPISTYLRFSPQVNRTLVLAIPPKTVAVTTNADDYFLKADKKLHQGDFKGAIIEFTEAIKLNPNYGIAYAGRGAAYLNINEKSNAIADFLQTVRTSPNSAVAYLARGVIRLDEKDYPRAISALDTALRINPSYVDAFIIRGIARFESGDKQGAIQDYDQAIQLNPNGAITYFNRGLVRFDLGDKQGAIQDYDRAIQVSPTFTWAYFARANVQNSLGDKQKAIADYESAAKLAKQQNDKELTQKIQFLLQYLKF